MFSNTRLGDQSIKKVKMVISTKVKFMVIFCGRNRRGYVEKELRVLVIL